MYTCAHPFEMTILSVSNAKFAADTNSFEVENYSARDTNPKGLLCFKP